VKELSVARRAAAAAGEDSGDEGDELDNEEDEFTEIAFKAAAEFLATTLVSLSSLSAC
jgi:hypothetical protein